VPNRLADPSETCQQLFASCEASAQVADRSTHERALSLVAGELTFPDHFFRTRASSQIRHRAPDLQSTAAFHDRENRRTLRPACGCRRVRTALSSSIPRPALRSDAKRPVDHTCFCHMPRRCGHEVTHSTGQHHHSRQTHWTLRTGKPSPSTYRLAWRSTEQWHRQMLVRQGPTCRPTVPHPMLPAPCLNPRG
jgi:hypothetical protein